jgi:hypothetical protein
MSLLDYFRTVLWSFIGIGSRASNSEDLGKVKPLGLLAVTGVLLFVFLGTMLEVPEETSPISSTQSPRLLVTPSRRRRS